MASASGRRSQSSWFVGKKIPWLFFALCLKTNMDINIKIPVGFKAKWSLFLIKFQFQLKLIFRSTVFFSKVLNFAALINDWMYCNGRGRKESESLSKLFFGGILDSLSVGQLTLLQIQTVACAWHAHCRAKILYEKLLSQKSYIKQIIHSNFSSKLLNFDQFFEIRM